MGHALLPPHAARLTRRARGRHVLFVDSDEGRVSNDAFTSSRWVGGEVSGAEGGFSLTSGIT